MQYENFVKNRFLIRLCFDYNDEYVAVHRDIRHKVPRDNLVLNWSGIMS